MKRSTKATVIVASVAAMLFGTAVPAFAGTDWTETTYFSQCNANATWTGIGGPRDTGSSYASTSRSGGCNATMSVAIDNSYLNSTITDSITRTTAPWIGGSSQHRYAGRGNSSQW